MDAATLLNRALPTGRPEPTRFLDFLEELAPVSWSSGVFSRLPQPPSSLDSSPKRCSSDIHPRRTFSKPKAEEHCATNPQSSQRCLDRRLDLNQKLRKKNLKHSVACASLSAEDFNAHWQLSLVSCHCLKPTHTPQFLPETVLLHPNDVVQKHRDNVVSTMLPLAVHQQAQKPTWWKVEKLKMTKFKFSTYEKISFFE